MHTRLKEIRKHFNLTQAEMAERLKYSWGGYIKIENNQNGITDRLIATLCREFNVSEEWLRTGEGDMINPASSVDAELLDSVTEVIQSDDEFVKHAVLLSIKAMQNMNDTQQADFVRIIRNMVAALPPDDGQ